jgi:hypothetical protein
MGNPALDVPRRLAPDAWADRFRLACQSCAQHLAGPVVAWSALVEHLNEEERTAVGWSIVQASLDRLDTNPEPAVRRREECVVAFVSSLFGLDRC